METNLIIKEFIENCSINDDENGRYFSTTLENYTNFMNKYKVDFHELWDNIEPEEKLKYLYR